MGDTSLNRYQAYYCDTGKKPTPDPRTFAHILLKTNTRAFLIVDNCPQKLHRELTQICSVQDSQISLITIEYDIREDEPEGTDVYRLEPASTDLIESLLRSRFTVAQGEARRIAEFAGGNARIAMALAVATKNSNVLKMNDDELFRRLFFQRHDHSDSLMRSAEVAALVYSFDANTDEGYSEEMTILCSLVEQDSGEFYRNAVLLLGRGLMQKRGIWRAVLPHAIANRLASRVIKNGHLAIISG